MASYWESWWLMDGIRTAVSVIDSIIYFLISVLYQIFFNVANATLISGETIKAFYGRIQLILGILIMFKLAVSLISGIMNPDSITESKNGFFGIIKRIVIALIMLVLIVPLNIPTSDLGENGGYNSQLNNNGILFGTLYELQNIVLSQNTIARLILGVSSNVDSGDINRTAKEAGNELATIILKCFVTINVKHDDGDPLVHEDRMCQDSDSQEHIIDYLDPTITTSGILNRVNEYCEVEDNDGVSEIDEGEDYYVFNYSMFLSTVVGVLFVIVLLGFIIDVAIRSFKLAILRLISPVPIISYVDPKSEQNGAFGAWVKSVTSTYIDLFIRLAMIYFILFIIQEFSTNGIVMDVGSGAVGLFSRVFIILGLFFFAKEAPGFIQSSLGIKNKGPGNGLFSGIGKMFGAASGVAGAYKGAVGGFRASRRANEINNALDPTARNSGWNRWVKPLGSGFVSALGGAGAALTTARDSNDHQFRRAMNRVNQMNATRMNYANDGSTWWGGVKSGVGQAFTGQSGYERLQLNEARLKRQIEEAKGRKDALATIQSMAEDKARTSDKTFGQVSLNGRSANLNYNEFMSKRQAAASSGASNFDVNVYDSAGNVIRTENVNMTDAMSENFTKSLLDANTSDYLFRASQNASFDVGLHNHISVNSEYTPSSSDMALKDLKDVKNGHINDEFRLNNELDSVREQMPQAKANDERGRREYK